MKLIKELNRKIDDIRIFFLIKQIKSLSKGQDDLFINFIRYKMGLITDEHLGLFLMNNLFRETQQGEKSK